jgi:hypothetical protein
MADELYLIYFMFWNMYVNYSTIFNNTLVELEILLITIKNPVSDFTSWIFDSKNLLAYNIGSCSITKAKLRTVHSY